ncbi:hypothetical protein Pyrfu_1591 [Pyrolobus fumarii 1A]|uniref:ArnR1-like winged helix-turn-helix domain-containing protein n=1 Tax=Pyrolobus fumarii (strain DSM 11204 / 1A) TaxID=694429 RepID=G0EC78_PYRF1|nr:hypothetical protein Pyrfu_1591 [Pyrolobus fumarii 1A]
MASGGNAPRRNAITILVDVLRCIEKLQNSSPYRAAKRSEVAQCSNLNTATFNKYITVLESAGLVTLKRTPRYVFIRLTHHGYLVLRMLERLVAILHLASHKPHVLRLGVKITRKLHEDLPPSLPPKLSPLLLEECDYVVIVLGSKAVCLRASSDNSIEVRCCRINHRVECETLHTVTLNEIDNVEDLLKLIRSKCLSQ